ncbi:MAG: glycogen/starch synthase, partial [Turicibacter sp.]|nr:glycogen/starch synthase [Turicibacter sp.]
DTKTIYTIHNLRFQGNFTSGSIRSLGYRFDDQYANYMEVGIQYAHKITTVSETYANEILTDFYGEGLNHILGMRSQDLSGIVNGIDIDLFDPSTDPALVAAYSVKTLKKKAQNKLALQEKFGMDVDPDVPMIGIVTRLDSQKGLDLITHVLEDILYHNNVQFFLLGSGEYEYEQFFQSLRDRYSHKFGIYLGYNGKLANQVYAASDMFLMPSLYEPCGLSQLISLRYGTVPIVRETGGLNDTVHAFNEFEKTGNGFSFTNYNAHDMKHTIDRALEFYANRPADWKKLVKNGMEGDYSWDKSAQKYLELYQSM